MSSMIYSKKYQKVIPFDKNLYPERVFDILCMDIQTYLILR